MFPHLIGPYWRCLELLGHLILFLSFHRCNERDFNEYRFSGPVVRYPFSDHNAPQFEQILALCRDVMEFLNAHPENVVAINCKAGKVS